MTAKYPGYRTMTGTQRRNERMFRIFEDARLRARAYEREGENMIYGTPRVLVSGRTYSLVEGVGMVCNNT